MSKNKEKNTHKKEIGAQKKSERAKAKTILAQLKGKDARKLNQKDSSDLLAALALLLNVVDSDFTIK